jgi:hypothetical protein
MPKRDHTTRFGELHSADHQCHQIQPGQIPRQQLGQLGFSHRNEPA